MKNNRSGRSSNKNLYTLITFGVIVMGISLLIMRPSGSNQLTQERKEILSPALPPGNISEVSTTVVLNRKKVIQTLSVNPRRTVTVFGEVNRATEQAAHAITALSKESKEPILLLIDSPGGSVFSGEKVVSAIEASKADVYTVCIGLCASMAAIIHQYGTKRYATDRSVLMFHDASALIGGRVSEMLSLLNLIKRKLEKTNRYIANRAKMPYAEFVTLGANNFWIDSEDAMDKHLVDGLVVLE